MALNVEVSGGGPDLVLLHGWGMNAAVWDEMATHLVRYFRVHRVDLPGHGASSACAPYTLDALADVPAAALPRRVTVCGWSLGGQVALNWARRIPDQVDRLVLIATTPRFVRGTGWEYGIDPAVLDGFAYGLTRDYRGTLQRFLVLQSQGDADARTVLRRLRGQVLMRGEPDIAALEAGLRILKETDLRDKLSQISQPALILHGAHDTVAPLAAGQYLQRALPRATLEVFAGAAHAPFVAQPQRVAQRITEFCGEQ
ncbi:MAG: pimeloyl-ACP methyl ester esterase BioH [Betaproteobacteria bacterium]|nr:pimeloyl-ACP methyl ester esterase BioH [Betaproteobacteria bacterium]